MKVRLPPLGIYLAGSAGPQLLAFQDSYTATLAKAVRDGGALKDVHPRAGECSAEGMETM